MSVSDTKPEARYSITPVHNEFTGTRYNVIDRQHDGATVAEFRDIGHVTRNDAGRMAYTIVERVGLENAQMFCEVLNVQDEASRGE